MLQGIAASSALHLPSGGGMPRMSCYSTCTEILSLLVSGAPPPECLFALRIEISSFLVSGAPPHPARFSLRDLARVLARPCAGEIDPWREPESIPGGGQNRPGSPPVQRNRPLEGTRMSFCSTYTEILSFLVSGAPTQNGFLLYVH